MNKISNVQFDCYDEEEAVNSLDKNLDIALKASNVSFEENPDNFVYDQITIIVNGVAHGFLLGGPQAAGIQEFIKNICDENGYDYPWGMPTWPLTPDSMCQHISIASEQILCEFMAQQQISTGDTAPEQELKLEHHFRAIAGIYLSIIEQNRKV